MAYTRYIPKKDLVDLEIFEKLVFQIGTIIEANLLLKAKKPSFEFNSDFGNNDFKKSCGQFVANYKPEEIINKQIFALTNLKPVRIAGVKSEYLTLGFNDEQKNGQAIAITPFDSVDNGLKFNLKCEKIAQKLNDLVDYDLFDKLEVKSALIIDVITSKNTFLVVYFGDNVYDMVLVPGILKDKKEIYLNIQIPVITNIKLNLEVSDVKCLAFTIPIDNKQNVTIMKVDKKVENNLSMF